MAYSRKYDITTAFGMLLLIYQARRLRTYGCAWYGIPCSSWVFMRFTWKYESSMDVPSYTYFGSSFDCPRSRGTSRRSRFRVRGEGKFRSVREANKIARRISYMLHYHWTKSHYYVLEQPISSILFRYKCIKKRLRAHNAVRVVVHVGTYGAATTKPAPGWQGLGYSAALNQFGQFAFHSLHTHTHIYIYIYEHHLEFFHTHLA